MTKNVTAKHLAGHGLSYRQHFKNNWRFSWLALKSAALTLGHGITPLISGRRASELHNQIWLEGRQASIEDLTHRLNSGFYKNEQEALADYQDYASLYDESQVMTDYQQVISEYYKALSE